jgi:hypothetical protein
MGMIAKDWNTNPIRFLRSSEISSVLMGDIGWLNRNISPLVGRSNPPMMFNNVVFPEPDLPRNAARTP